MNNMKKPTAIASLFRTKTPLETAAAELVQAELHKLEAETAREYAASLVEYNTARIKRLRKYIEAQTAEATL